MLRTNKFEFHAVTEQGIEKIVKYIPSNKALGLDRVSAGELKDILPATLPVIINLMNTLFASNSFAQVLKSVVVIPNLKSGDRNGPENTRPISLLPIMSKVCEKAAHTQFMDFLDKIARYPAYRVKTESSTPIKPPYYTSRTISLRIWMRNEYLWLYYSSCLKISTASNMTPL